MLIEAGGATSFETLLSWVKQHNFRPPWLFVISKIEKATRVCVYDRAGLGRSRKAPLPRTSADVATDQRALCGTKRFRHRSSVSGSRRQIQLSNVRESLSELIAGMVLVNTRMRICSRR